MKLTPVLLLSSLILLAACGNDDDNVSFPSTVALAYDFQNDAQSWEGDFADYPVGEEDFYELSYEHANLPEPLDTSVGALRQSGNNHSDDLFMLIRRRIDELEPNATYSISYEIVFASDVADGQVGVGGSPGEGVTLKAGATSFRPEKTVVQSDYRMNIDKGNQATGGPDMVVIGDFSNDTDQNQYTLKTLVADDALTVTTDSNGELWLIIGTDSGFEATTTIYYSVIEVRLEKQ